METDGRMAAPATGSLGQEESPSRNWLRRRIVTDVSCQVVDRKEYEPYGVEIRPVTNSAGNTHQYTGHERDAASGLDYMHYRFYGSNIGRFMKPDNIMGNMANPQSWNLYSYVGNNPVNRNDPTGHWYSTGPQTRGTYSWDVPAGDGGNGMVSNYFGTSFNQALSLFNTSSLTQAQQTSFTGALWTLYNTPMGNNALSLIASRNLPIEVRNDPTARPANTEVHYSGQEITGFTINLNFNMISGITPPVPNSTGLGPDFNMFSGKAFRGKAGKQWILASVLGHELSHVGFDLANPSVALEYECLSNTWTSLPPGEMRRAQELRALIETYSYSYQQGLEGELNSLFMTGFRP